MKDFKTYVPKPVIYILDKLDEAGYEAYIVGGCIRDLMLGKTPKDWDITTSATPKVIQRVFKDYKQIDTGIKHGTIGVIIKEKIVEITTFRIDLGYSDGRRPDRVIFTPNVVEDLARRDFTINACAMGKRGIIDPFDGQKDIEKGLIRSVGNPIERFTEDALRILRGIRFASELEFEIHGTTKRAMVEAGNMLKNISQERITMEFSKILLGSGVYEALIGFINIIFEIFPDIKRIVGPIPYRKGDNIQNIYSQTLKAVSLADNDIITRLSLFLYNIIRPFFQVKEELDGGVRGWEEKFIGSIEEILWSMRLSKKDISNIVQLIKNYRIEINGDRNNIKEILSRLGEAQLRRFLDLRWAHISAQNPANIKKELERIYRAREILDQLLAQNVCVTLGDLAIDGGDLIKLGLPQGKKIGILLDKMLEIVLKEEVENTKEALINKVRSLILDTNCTRLYQDRNDQ